MARVPQERGLLTLPTQGTRMRLVLHAPSPRSLLSPALIVKKPGAAVLKPGAWAARSEPWAFLALALPGKARGGDVKEAAVGDDASAAVHLQVGMSMEQSGLSSAGISFRFVKAVTCSCQGSRVSCKSLGSPAAGINNASFLLPRHQVFKKIVGAELLSQFLFKLSNCGRNWPTTKKLLGDQRQRACLVVSSFFGKSVETS